MACAPCSERKGINLFQNKNLRVRRIYDDKNKVTAGRWLGARCGGCAAAHRGRAQPGTLPGAAMRAWGLRRSRTTAGCSRMMGATL